MVLIRRGVLSTSLLCILAIITLPILLNLASNDLYIIFQRFFSLRTRLLIVTVMIILCVFAPIMEAIYHKDRRFFVRLFNVWKAPDSAISESTMSKFETANDPLRVDPDVRNGSCREDGSSTRSESTRADGALRVGPDVLTAGNTLHSYREEGPRNDSFDPSHIVLTVHTEQQVPDVEEALKVDFTTKGTTVLQRRFEIGPQTGNVDLHVLSLQIAEAMRRAREIDENCTLQFGSFAFLKYTDGALKSWRLHEHRTPVIYDICSPSNIVTGCPLPQQAGSPDSQNGRIPDRPVTDDPDLLSLVDCVVREIDKAMDEIGAQEESALSRCSGLAGRSIIPSAISRSSERLAQPSHQDVSLMACTEDAVSDLEKACLNPLKNSNTNIVGKQEEEGANLGRSVCTIIVAVRRHYKQQVAQLLVTHGYEVKETKNFEKLDSLLAGESWIYAKSLIQFDKHRVRVIFCTDTDRDNDGGSFAQATIFKENAKTIQLYMW